jgi:hypothetical protein
MFKLINVPEELEVIRRFLFASLDPMEWCNIDIFLTNLTITGFTGICAEFSSVGLLALNSVSSLEEEVTMINSVEIERLLRDAYTTIESMCGVDFNMLEIEGDTIIIGV